MDGIELFDPTRVCPKCGYTAVGVKYHKWASQWGNAPCRLAKEQEHLDRWCKRCFYDWVEWVLIAPLQADTHPSEPAEQR